MKIDNYKDLFDINKSWIIEFPNQKGEIQFDNMYDASNYSIATISVIGMYDKGRLFF